MPRTIDRTLPIKRYKKVVATVGLPGVPEGTVGKVRVANGFAWYRYWVDFDNGVRMGQVSHEHLCHEEDWGRFQFDRAEAEPAVLLGPADAEPAVGPELADHALVDAGLAELAGRGAQSGTDLGGDEGAEVLPQLLSQRDLGGFEGEVHGGLPWAEADVARMTLEWRRMGARPGVTLASSPRKL